MVTIKSVRRLFFYNTILLIIVCLLPYVISYIYPEIPYIELLAISTVGITLVMIFYFIIFIILSRIVRGIISPAESLAGKMDKCKLRLEKGLDYCAICPDGYSCASGKKND